jgi:hypothetical protein
MDMDTCCGICMEDMSANGGRGLFTPGCCGKWIHHSCWETNIIHRINLNQDITCPFCRRPYNNDYTSPVATAIPIDTNTTASLGSNNNELNIQPTSSVFRSRSNRRHIHFTEEGDAIVSTRQVNNIESEAQVAARVALDIPSNRRDSWVLYTTNEVSNVLRHHTSR